MLRALSPSLGSVLRSRTTVTVSPWRGMSLLGGRPRWVEQVPNPRGSDAARRSDTWVSDGAEVMSAGGARQFNLVAGSLQREFGVEMGLVTVREVQGARTGADVRAFATELFDFWGIGQPPANTGVMVRWRASSAHRVRAPRSAS